MLSLTALLNESKQSGCSGMICSWYPCKQVTITFTLTKMECQRLRFKVFPRTEVLQIILKLSIQQDCLILRLLAHALFKKNTAHQWTPGLSLFSPHYCFIRISAQQFFKLGLGSHLTFSAFLQLLNGLLVISVAQLLSVVTFTPKSSFFFVSSRSNRALTSTAPFTFAFRNSLESI